MIILIIVIFISDTEEPRFFAPSVADDIKSVERTEQALGPADFKVDDFHFGRITTGGDAVKLAILI